MLLLAATCAIFNVCGRLRLSAGVSPSLALVLTMPAVIRILAPTGQPREPPPYRQLHTWQRTEAEQRAHDAGVLTDEEKYAQRRKRYPGGSAHANVRIHTRAAHDRYSKDTRDAEAARHSYKSQREKASNAFERRMRNAPEVERHYYDQYDKLWPEQHALLVTPARKTSEAAHK